MADLDARIRAKAEQLWQERGRPEGGPEAFRKLAREELAILDNTEETLQPNPAREGADVDDAEPLRAVRNVGEQPNLTDQGESQDYPLRRGERTGRQSRSAEQERKVNKP